MGKLPADVSQVGWKEPTLTNPRQSQKLGVPTFDIAALDAPQRYQLIASARMDRALHGINSKLADQTKLVDEYQCNSSYSTTESIATLEVLPQFDSIAEKIESVFITGPPGIQFALQLGDRNFSLSTNDIGMCLISPVSFLLTRTDRRILTSATPGNWTMELMGCADSRY